MEVVVGCQDMRNKEMCCGDEKCVTNMLEYVWGGQVGVRMIVSMFAITPDLYCFPIKSFVF